MAFILLVFKQTGVACCHYCSYYNFQRQLRPPGGVERATSTTMCHVLLVAGKLDTLLFHGGYNQ